MSDESIFRSYIPANARILIQYEPKEEVKFSYPRKWTYKEAVKKNGFPQVMTAWFYLHFYFIRLLSPYIVIAGIGVLIYSIYILSTRIIIEGTDYLKRQVIDDKVTLIILSIALFIIFYFFLVPLIFTYFASRNKEYFSRLMPKLGYFCAWVWGDILFENFKPKDVRNNKIIIPSFDNVYLKYKCYGDFNKYLKKIEINEVPYSLYSNGRSFWRPFKLYKLKIVDANFCAIFYFSKKPLKGYLKTEYS